MSGQEEVWWTRCKETGLHVSEEVAGVNQVE